MWLSSYKVRTWSVISACKWNGTLDDRPSICFSCPTPCLVPISGRGLWATDDESMVTENDLLQLPWVRQSLVMRDNLPEWNIRTMTNCSYNPQSHRHLTVIEKKLTVSDLPNIRFFFGVVTCHCTVHSCASDDSVNVIVSFTRYVWYRPNYFA